MDDPTWRHQYHVVSIIHFHAIAHEQNNHRRRAWTSEEPYPDLLSSLRSRSTSDATASTRMPFIFGPVDHLQNQQGQDYTPLTSPTDMSRTFSAVSDFNLPELTEEWSCCPYEGCNATFKGKYSDKKNNCRRHIKKHEDKEIHLCRDDGCGKSFTNAWNLKRHVRDHHPELLATSSQSNATHKVKGKAKAEG